MRRARFRAPPMDDPYQRRTRLLETLRGLVFGLALLLAVVVLVLVAAAAADFATAWIAAHLSPAGVLISLAAALVLPAALAYASARSGQLGPVAISFTPVLVCVFTAAALLLRGPVAGAVASAIGRLGTVAVALVAFAVSAAGGLAGLILGHPRLDRPAQIASAALFGLSLGTWVLRVAILLLGWPLLLELIARVRWSPDAARLLNTPWFWSALQSLYLAALPIAAFVPAAALELWALARSSAPMPARLARSLRATEDRTFSVAWKPLFIDRLLGAAPICEVRWRPFGRPVLLLSRHVLERLDDSELEAVLAHEAGHVAWGHLRSRLVRAYLLWLLIVVLFRVFNLNFRTPLGYELGAVGCAFCYQFLLFFVVRAQEAQADRYAAEVVGADAVHGALTKLSSRPLEAYRSADLSIWTTHGSWTRRRDRLAGAPGSTPGGGV